MGGSPASLHDDRSRRAPPPALDAPARALEPPDRPSRKRAASALGAAPFTFPGIPRAKRTTACPEDLIGGGAEFLYIKFTRKEQTLILAWGLKGNLVFTRI